MAVIFEEVEKIGADMGWFPTEASEGVPGQAWPGCILVTQNNLAHRPDSAYLSKYIKGVDANPGFGRESASYLRGDCLSGGPFSGEIAVETMSGPQIDALGLKLYNNLNLRDTTGGNDFGCAYITGQANEAGVTTHTGRGSIRLAYRLGKLQDGTKKNGVQYLFTGFDYDGDFRETGTMPGLGNSVTLADLASRDAILAYMRGPAAPFGYMGFKQHTVWGAGAGGADLQVEGSVLYTTPLFRCYFTGQESPTGYFAAHTAIGIMLNREGMEALALLPGSLGGFRHSPEDQALLRSRTVCVFTATIKTQGDNSGSRNEIVQLPLGAGDYFQGVMFASNVYQPVLSMLMAALCERKGGFVFDFNPTAKQDDQIRSATAARTESGYPVGQFDTNGQPITRLPTATVVFQQVPDSTPVAFPESPQGLQDVLMDAAKQVGEVRFWTNKFDGLPYARLRVISRSDGVPDEPAFCSSYTDFEYVFRRFVLEYGVWGYTAYDDGAGTTGNAGLLVNMESIPPDVECVIEALINGQTIRTPPVFGGVMRAFIGRILTSV